MLSLRDVQDSNRFNETKAPILLCIAKASLTNHYLTTEEIADLCNLGHYNVSRQMTKLVGQGYVWRKVITLESGKKSFRYRFLKPMGSRVAEKLWVRLRLRELTGDDEIPLNLKHNIPSKYYLQVAELEKEYYHWLYSNSAK